MTTSHVIASVQSTADVRLYGSSRTASISTGMSEALIVGTVNQLCVADSSSSSVSVTGLDLPVAEDMKVLEMLSSSGARRFTNTYRRLLGRATIMCRPSVTSEIRYRRS